MHTSMSGRLILLVFLEEVFMSYFSRHLWFIYGAMAMFMCMYTAKANAAIVVYSTSMNGGLEAPPNASLGVGSATLPWIPCSIRCVFKRASVD